MLSRKTLLYYGALLGDVGEVVARQGEQPESIAGKLGYDLITEALASRQEDACDDDKRSIAEHTLYRASGRMADSGEIPEDSLVLITSYASQVAAGMRDASDNVAQRGDGCLRKIFNKLNGHNDDNTVEHEDYTSLCDSLREGLADIQLGSDGTNALLTTLDDTLSSLPASVDDSRLMDVSLCDLAKVRAGIAACVLDYLDQHDVKDYRTALSWDEGAGDAPMFLLYSCDMSGIQDFIYNISGAGALKQLRARSMYLELLLEHIVDELLDRMDLCRANLLYAGGGHAYLLLPHTAESLEVLQSFQAELRAWFVEEYRTDLFVAGAWTPCCANELANWGDDKRRYPELFRRLSRSLSEAKAARYDADTMRQLNFSHATHFDHARECNECHRSDLRLVHIDGEDKCPLCAALGRISSSLVHRDLFVVEKAGDTRQDGPRNHGLALPFGYQLRMCSASEYQSVQHAAHRIYAKNESELSGEGVTQILMGDYTADMGTEGLAAYALQGQTLGVGRGISRLGVLRADVDDLGTTFAGGLPEERTSLVHTAVLSKAVNRFFKSEINDILRRGEYQAQIIYSGGDDLFIVGNWSDVLYAAIDIRKALQAYTGNGSLTISAGIGMFDKTYPIARMAAETGELEDSAKAYRAKDTGLMKNAVCLWSSDVVFGWDEFTEVVEPRMRTLRSMFEESQKGKALIYRIIALLRSYEMGASAPRLAYLLARSFEDNHKHGGDICRQLYAWAQDPAERRALVTALEWYACSTRETRSE